MKLNLEQGGKNPGDRASKEQVIVAFTIFVLAAACCLRAASTRTNSGSASYLTRDVKC